ncbi:cupin domain-containing protein [Natronosalvus rutilus]|uniref:Cupin domain-containing protein n=1 Tax=Natronosalvus rutilus TaxID=2953753 RepID=A0A9E7NCG6_9EURY|nr:cupin domain-containing protein [Natronosalvus rutilus]UTF55742.1 cupin domain-containing protein [Natronosalvus rutilus]
MSVDIDYDGDPFRPTKERPKASVVRFDDVEPWARHASDIGCNFDHLVWGYDLPASRWFDRGELRQLDPGEYTDFQSHREDVEGPVEKVVRVVSGRGVLRTEHRDEPLERFDLVTVPTGAAYQLGNAGTNELWLASWTSVGDNHLHEASTLEPAERTGAREEYERVMAARTDEGLQTAPGYAGDYDGDPDEDRPEPTVTRFAESMPKVFHESPAVGCNADRPDWITTTEDLEWFSDSVVMRLDPGTYTSLHTHFDNEGPHEEVYWVMAGEARLVTEYRDERLRRFDCAFFPTNNPHSIGNVGTDTLWVGAWGARGGREAEFELDDLEVSERPGQAEEYERVMAARKERGLSTPSWVSFDDE